MSQPDGHVEPIAGAAWQPPQPQRGDLPGVAARQRPGPLPVDVAGPGTVGAPGTVGVAALVSLVLGVLLVVFVLGTFGDAPLSAVTRLVFPAILLAGAAQAMRGRRGLLTTGAVFLVVSGAVLAVQVVGSDDYETGPAMLEAGVRLVAGVLVLVLSRVPASADFFDTMAERRYGRPEADFFR